MWGFQSRLGIITRTLAAATPQLAHLLVVLAACMALFALVLVLGAGGTAAPASTAGDAFYDTFLLLLGGSNVGRADLLPRGASGARVLLGGLIFYCRELLFIFVLMNFFMAVVGDVFSRIKDATAPRSIGADLRRDVLPELRGWLAARRAAWRARRGRVAPSGGGDSGAAAAAAPPETSAVLLERLQAAYPGLVLARSKGFGDKVDCIKIDLGTGAGPKLVNLGTLQRLLADLSLDSGAAQLLATLPAAACHKEAVAAAADGNPVAGGAAGAAAAAAPAMAAGGDARAVAAALSVAERLVAELGQPCTAEQLRAAPLQVASTGIGAGLDSDEQVGDCESTAHGLLGQVPLLLPPKAAQTCSRGIKAHFATTRFALVFLFRTTATPTTYAAPRPAYTHNARLAPPPIANTPRPP